MTEQQAIDYLSQFYDQHRRDDEYEPTYLITPFAEFSTGEEIDATVIEFAETVKKGIHMTKSFFGGRVVEDGFKVGTSSWVFMERRNSPILKVGKCFATRRTICEEVLSLFKQNDFDVKEMPMELWALFGLDDEGFTLMDRNPGTLSAIQQIQTNPAYFGIPI